MVEPLNLSDANQQNTDVKVSARIMKNWITTQFFVISAHRVRYADVSSSLSELWDAKALVDALLIRQRYNAL